MVVNYISLDEIHTINQQLLLYNFPTVTVKQPQGPVQMFICYLVGLLSVLLSAG